MGQDHGLFYEVCVMTLADQVAEIGNRIERTGIRLKEALSVIDVTSMTASHFLPYEAFAGLNLLIDRTVHGARIERFHPQKAHPFSYPRDSYRRR